MLEPLFDWLFYLVRHFGLPGLFFSSLLISTIFVPFNVEFLFPILLKAGIGRFPIIVAATVGSLCGTLINYYIGYKGVGLLNKHVKKKDLDKASHIMNEYGWIGLLAVTVAPILSVDPLTIICGATRMNIWEFILVVAVGKFLKYAIVLGLIELLFRMI
ncbi:SNARE associated Golgi protein [uncultured archaeon]|nr:SNARE associated Golgi protein [uncultured archaeon]